MILRQKLLSIASVAVLVIACGILFLTYRHSVLEQAIHHGEQANVTLAHVFKNTIWPRYQDFILTAGQLTDEDLRQHPSTASLRADVEAFIEGSKIVGVNIHDVTQRTVFSTQPTQIGQSKKDSAPLVMAVSGSIASEFNDRNRLFGNGKGGANHDFIASYVPVYGADGQPVGVIEIDNDITAVIDEIRSAEYLNLFYVVLSLCAVFLCLMVIVNRAYRFILRQHYDITKNQKQLEEVNAALAAQVAEREIAEKALAGLNDILDQRVAERTEALQQREAALFESEQRFRHFAAASSDWFWEMDEGLRFTYLSSRFGEVTGINPRRMLGRTSEEIGPPDIESERWQRHLDALQNHRTFRNFFRPAVKEDGRTIWFSINGIPYFDERGSFKGYRGTGQDVTELVDANHQAEQARQEAERANRAKSAFLANMSHELRTPLNAIIGYAELMQEEAEDRQDLRSLGDLSKVRRAGRHLLGLINNVLDLSKIEAGKMDVTLDPVDLSQLVRDVADTVRPLVAEKENALIVNTAIDLQHVITDGQKLRQILLNLLGNAVKFTRDGEIRFDVTQVGQDSLRFEVSDTGSGMTAEQVDTIFDPFTQGSATTDEKYGGTGLGLAICKSFTEMLNGRLEVESSPGKGTRFVITLPIHPVDVAESTPLTA